MLDLNKGMSLDLTKTVDTVFEIALRWDPANVGEDVDVDASAFLLSNQGGLHKLTSTADVVFFNNKNHVSGCASLSEDSTDGRSNENEDDEVITIDTKLIPSTTSQIRVYINIFKPAIAFNQVNNAKAIVRTKGGNILAQFNMSQDFTTENSILVGIIQKINGNWSFTAEGEGYQITDLNTIFQTLNAGVN